MDCEIRDWFSSHADEIDFFVAPRSYPFAVFPPATAADAVIYCTKKQCLYHLVEKLNAAASFGAIMRGGLPSDTDMHWLQSIVGSRRLLFLGDADPPDLLLFAWLRQRMNISYVGTCEQLLAKCGVPLGENLTIPMSNSERAAMPLLRRHLPDAGEVVGEWCYDLLESEHKIELEALFSGATVKPEEMQSFLMA